MRNPRHRGLTLVECAVIALIVAVFVAMLLPAIRAARKAARRAQHRTNMLQIGLGFLNFHDSYKRLPSAVRTDEVGRQLSSWRFQIAPYLEAIMMSVEFDDRWDSPVNRRLGARGHLVYCWSGATDPPQSWHTNVVAITGPGTAFEDGRVIGLKDMDHDTILAIEIAETDFHWMEPGDLDIDHIPASITTGMEGDDVLILFADGAVWRVRSEVPLADLKRFFTIQGAKQYDRDKILRPYSVPWPDSR